MARNANLTEQLSELRAVAEVIAFAIAREKASAGYYARALTKARSLSVQKTYATLIELDKEHEKKLRTELDKIRLEIGSR